MRRAAARLSAVRALGGSIGDAFASGAHMGRRLHAPAAPSDTEGCRPPADKYPRRGTVWARLIVPTVSVA
eukprot:7185640-Prymnesium_polylepis.1